MAKKKFECDTCGNTVTADEKKVPMCCGKKMRKA